MKPRTLRVVTVDDIVRGGACLEGTLAWRDAKAPLCTAISVDEALGLASAEEAQYVAMASGRAGNGDGDGNGDGYGYGNGYGNGYGYG